MASTTNDALAGLTARSRRRVCGAFLAASIALVVVNLAPLAALTKLWMFAGHEYGFIIVGAAVGLLWRERGALQASSIEPTWRALLLIAPLGAAVWIADLVDLRIAQLMLLIASFGALTWAMLGTAMFRIVSYPLALLMLALPIWNYFRPVLQDMTVAVTAFALRAFGMPVFVDETMISIPQRTILVLAECSGVQYFQAGITLGALHAGFNFSSWRVRLLIIALFGATAVAGNWIRVLTLVFAGELTDWQHFGIGWGVFAVLLILMFLATTRIPDRQVPRTTVAGAVERPRRCMIIGAVSAGILVLGPAAEYLLAAPEGLDAYVLEPALARAPWSGAQTLSDDRPSFQGTDADSLVVYSDGATEVFVYGAYYVRQRQGHEVVNELNHAFDRERWSVRGGEAGTHYREVALEGGVLKVIETRLHARDGSANRLVWHWYYVAGEQLARPWRAKLAQVRGVLHGRRDALAVVISTDFSSIEAARDELASFLELHPELMRAVPRAAAERSYTQNQEL